ncbi:sulfatase [Crateriforma conspicua]|uniref:Choline-sulfatase n=1 Tax=Crateriforma conspicua TaxID=2527996 RepID=A0A5C5Y670_9PLAN|nr:sulfatase [Crateriforma conspicua]QDV65786.1 Choline-sulfatase [Crateriforma conspicua]TWT71186.1 Choline-sulfatase [Crateriforma conspicua]
MLIHRSVLSLIVLIAAGASCPAPLPAADRPNVLFIISDDLNTRIGCYGDPQVQTPNLDALAQRGVRFEHAYCQYPLCGPSRNSMLTGLYPNQTGILVNAAIFRQSIPEQVSLPQAFRRAGYFAARIGKLYHYHVPRSMGTNGNDDPASWEMEINPAGCDRLIEQPDIFSLREGSFGGTLSWYASPRSDEQHTDGMMADEACWVLERCAQRDDRPFFLAVGMYRPHTPYVAPKKYFDLYDVEQMPVVQNIQEDIQDVPEAALLSQKKEQDKLTDSLRRECIQAYYASTSFMDAQVGKILAKLDELGLADDTIVVFTSDHGYHLGEKNLWQKMSLFEQSARVPLIIAAPGRKSAVASEAPVGLVDLYPTLTELCGVPTPSPITGQSLVPMLDDPTEPGRGWSITQVRRTQKKQTYMGYSLRTPRFRYTRWDDAKRGVELYDHAADPLEHTNLAAQPEFASVCLELENTLTDAISVASPDGDTPKIKHPQYLPILIDP